MSFLGRWRGFWLCSGNYASAIQAPMCRPFPARPAGWLVELVRGGGRKWCGSWRHVFGGGDHRCLGGWLTGKWEESFYAQLASIKSKRRAERRSFLCSLGGGAGRPESGRPASSEWAKRGALLLVRGWTTTAPSPLPLDEIDMRRGGGKVKKERRQWTATGPLSTTTSSTPRAIRKDQLLLHWIWNLDAKMSREKGSFAPELKWIENLAICSLLTAQAAAFISATIPQCYSSGYTKGSTIDEGWIEETGEQGDLGFWRPSETINAKQGGNCLSFLRALASVWLVVAGRFPREPQFLCSHLHFPLVLSPTP